ncbi:MAG: phosphoribosylformylglycinamidine synthase subunit PurS, partial [Candidatus Glassbacteria bacterium]
MIHRIEVGYKPGVKDPLGDSVARAVAEDLELRAGRVRTVAVYTTNLELRAEQVERLGRELFADPVIQRFSVDRPLEDGGFDWLLEVGYRPGVTDNVGHTASQGARDMLGVEPGPSQGFFTSRQYLFEGGLSREEVERVARDLLANELIERWQIIGRTEWESGKRVAAVVPVVTGGGSASVAEYDLEVEDRELVRISEAGLLSLTLEEMKAIQAYYRRGDVRVRRAGLGLGPRPTDVELECIAQTWSEHCKHKIFNCLIDYSEEGGAGERIDSLFKTYVRRATDEIAGRTGDWLISVFHDNAGVIAFDDDWGLAMKVETHNSPSALDPYGGAITGIVGVNRDILGTGIGCRMIFNTDVFCFARPDYNRPLEGKLLHPKRIFKGVHRGVRDGGNQSGIPTVNGAIVFDDRFRGKPLVFCGTGGIIPREVAGRPSHEKKIWPGDHIVMVGGRIGKDGIHGATFSSLELDEHSPASAVQIGDPITQKKMADCLLEARDAGLVRTLTDNGAGGLSSSVGELARISGGAELHLERAPLKYQGLAPWEILLSEAQERMSVVVAPEHLK